MERGPLPPHERSWRHPSEVAAEQRAVLRAEGSPTTTRLLALATGTMGLLAVGLLMVTITPRRADSPIAISASTTSVVVAQAARTPAALSPTSLRSDAVHVLATPIGDGRFALVTRASLLEISRSVIDVRLPSGRLSAGSIVTASDDAVIVALATAEPGHDIARQRPDDDEMVTVMASPPVTVVFGDVDTLAVDEGTAVFDDAGDLVGLCSRHAESGRVRLIEVDATLDDATSVVP